MVGFRYASRNREDVGEELRAAWIDCLHYQLGWPMKAALARTLEEERRTHAKRLLRTLANERDVPYQSLLKVFLAERVAKERDRPRRRSRASA